MSGTGEDFEGSIPADSEVPRLRLRQLRPHGDALVLLTVTAEEVGLSATVDVHTLNGDGLDDFFMGLDQDFRGWPGERHWKSHEGSGAAGCSLRPGNPPGVDPEIPITRRRVVGLASNPPSRDPPGEELKDLVRTIAAMFG